MLLKFLSFFCAFLTYYCAFSQFQTTIQGQLLDKETNVPVVFANIYMNESGTSSNQLGRFILSFNANQKDTLLTISCIGYETKRISSKNDEKEVKIFLEPKTEILREVVITELTPKQIFKKAEKALLRNFSSPAFSARFFLEQYIISDSAEMLLGFSHTNGRLNDKLNDSAKVFPRIRLDSISVSECFLAYDTITNIGFNVVGLAHSLSPYFFLSALNPVKHFLSKGSYQDDFYESINITLEGIVDINGVEHYSISLVSNKSEKKHDKTGYFLINSKDFGIRNVVIKLNGYSPDGTVAGKAHVSASYEKIKSKYYLSNMDILITKNTNLNPGNDPQIFDKAFYFSSIQFTEIKTKKIDRIKKGLPLTREAHYRVFPHTKIVSDSITPINWQYIKNGNFLLPTRDCFDCPLNKNIF